MGIILKQFTNHVGLDLKSSDINRRQEYASDMLNAQYRKNGNITKREGYRGFTESDGGQGLANYNRINPDTGVREEILVGIDDNLKKLTEASFTVNYSGAELSVAFDLFFDTVTDQYRVQMMDGIALVLDFPLGIGIDEISPVDLTDLKTAIDAVTSFSATIVGDTTIPAAFLDLKRGIDLTAADVVMTARHLVEVNSPSAQVLPGNVTFKNDDQFENTSWVQLNNNLYLGNGYDDIIKYDGQQVYKAGMPKGIIPVPALGAAGLLTGTYDYILLPTQFDANGNIIEGIASDKSSSIVPAAQSIDVTISNILEASGFNTGCAIANGIQAGVNTIVVDNGSGGGHTLKVGDTAYFFDGVSAGYVERNITSITGTSITIAGAAVNVADNEVISNNLRLGLYRTLNSGTSRFLVAEYANNSFTFTQVVNDNIIDISLGIEYIVPLIPHGLPPKGRYVSSYNNQMFIAGNLENPNFAFWSSTEGPEYFDTSLLNLRLQSPNGDKIRGLKQSNEVMAIFEDKAIHIISGDIPSLAIRVETITKDIGCVSHHSIQEVRGRLYFLSDRGVYTTVSGQLPVERSTGVEPLFDQSSIVDEDQKLVLKRAIAINDRDKEQYVLFIPAESKLGADVYANDFSKVIVEDYYRGAWLIWDNMNMGAGAVIYKGNLTFSEKRNSVFSGSVENYLYSVSNRGDSYDFQDNNVPVNFEYKSTWYHLGEPSVFKKYLRFKLFGTQETEFNSFRLDVDVEKDFLEDFVVGTFDIDFGSGSAGYGISPYGESPYGDVVDPNRKHKIGPIKAKSIRLVLKNSEKIENVNVTGWELQVAVSYKPEIKE